MIKWIKDHSDIDGKTISAYTILPNSDSYHIIYIKGMYYAYFHNSDNYEGKPIGKNKNLTKLMMKCEERIRNEVDV